MKKIKKYTIKDLYASDDFMAGFRVGEAKAKNKKMKKARGKTTYGWAVPNRMGGIGIFTAQMPIFWNKKVAEKYALSRQEKRKVIRVVIEIL